MRKKLLALLMCATMVLGTGVTAMAAIPSEDTFDAAKKVFSNGSKIIAEYEGSKKVTTTIVLSDGSSETWGLKVNTATNLTDATPIKLNDDGKALTKVLAYDSTASNGIVVADADKYDYKEFANVGSDSSDVATRKANGDLQFKVKDVVGGGSTPASVSYSDLVKAGTYSTGTQLTETNLNSIDTVDKNLGSQVYANPSATAKLAGTYPAIAKLEQAGAVAVGLKDGNDYVAYVTVDAPVGGNITANYYFVGSEGTVVAKYAKTAASYASVDADLSAVANTDLTPVAASTLKYYNASDLTLDGDGIYRLSAKQYVVVLNTATKTIPDYYVVDADGYIDVVDKDVTLATADLSSITRDDDSTADYYIVLNQFSTSDANYSVYMPTVAYALDADTLSKNAVALGFTVYKSTTDGSITPVGAVNKVKKLVKVDSVSSDVKVELNADVLSRTGLKNDTTLAVYTIDKSDTYKKDNFTLARLEQLDNADVSTKFTLSVKDFTNGILIFDGATDESNNDGVSDTTTTTTAAAAATSAETAATSPKTGDVAPIAALAVVMMGACGAMVVASKKRA
jgi:hypothetical protein